LIISNDESTLDDEKVVWIESLSVTQALDTTKLKELVPEEYYKFMNLFRETPAKAPPPH
jgi:hypothetical protein